MCVTLAPPRRIPLTLWTFNKDLCKLPSTSEDECYLAKKAVKDTHTHTYIHTYIHTHTQTRMQTTYAHTIQSAHTHTPLCTPGALCSGQTAGWRKAGSEVNNVLLSASNEGRDTEEECQQPFDALDHFSLLIYSLASHYSLSFFLYLSPTSFSLCYLLYHSQNSISLGGFS